MPQEIIRSDARTDNMDRYAEAALAAGVAKPIVQEFGRPVSASVGGRGWMPAVSSNQIRVGGLYEQETDRPIDDELVRRSAERRALAGLPEVDAARPEIDDIDDVPPPTRDEILHTVESLVPTASMQRGHRMNRIASTMIRNLISGLEMDPTRRRWLMARADGGISDPDGFLRDLRLSTK